MEARKMPKTKWSARPFLCGTACSPSSIDLEVASRVATEAEFFYRPQGELTWARVLTRVVPKLCQTASILNQDHTSLEYLKL